jgi:hypothetical protein
VKYPFGIAVLLFGFAAAAAASADREKLIGAWETRADGESRTVWTLATNGDNFRLTAAENDRKVSDIECNTVGRECELKVSGKPIKVTMWFNGPKLVVMETRGAEVLKRRFQATGDGTLELEVIPIVPQGKPELIRLSRVPASQ